MNVPAKMQMVAHKIVTILTEVIHAAVKLVTG